MSTNGISIDKSQLQPPNLERFLVDSDIDPELVFLLRKVGFRATHASWRNIPNDDTKFLVWARKYGYILVSHDKHRDTKTKYSFYSEMYYRGGRVIRVGKPGQPILRLLGCILAQRHRWLEHFASDSGEAVVHPSGCNFNNACELFERSKFALRLPFEDPSIPLKSRRPLSRKSKPIRKPPSSGQPPLL
ncbi:MAG: DUF5615 family PIN-like protein [Dehalococcoidales bacterium]|nr:DUF5615 family PIN-like protein [Dehalococcoidales bacterium]